jgi:tRNA(Ile)-lysidine synthetase-like protein
MIFYGVITDVISVNLKPGVYVVAVSGGVDSMVLLDLVRRLTDVELVVAHVEHGIRSDSVEDAELVRRVAMSHNLSFEMTQLDLGKDASEEEARNKRYAFLREVCKKYNASAILTAHHKDDLIETAIINMLRGTGWRGLSSLRSAGDVIRPLLAVSKSEIREYAEEQSLTWRHDSTNDDMRYLRNRVRQELLPKMSNESRLKFYEYIVRQNELTEQIDHEATKWLAQNNLLDSPVLALPRYQLIMMPQNVAHELLQTVLRRKVGKSVPRPLAHRALLFVHVAKPHRTFPIGPSWQLRALPREVIVEQRPGMVS